MGEKAVVPVGTDVVVGAVGLTVTRIDQGTPADLTADPGFATEYEGWTPYYVWVTISHEAGGELAGSYADGSDMGTTLSTGGPAPQSTNATIGPCESSTSTSGFDAPGLSYETCLTGLAPPGASITGAHYSGTTDLGAPVAGAPDYAYSGLDWR
jgi:hypothetical protein